MWLMCCFIASDAFVFRLSVFSCHNHFYSFAHFACFASDIFTIPCSRKAHCWGSMDYKTKKEKSRNFSALILKANRATVVPAKLTGCALFELNSRKHLQLFAAFISVSLRTCIFLYVSLCAERFLFLCVSHFFNTFLFVTHFVYFWQIL